MSDERVIQYADLRAIENNLRVVHDELQSVRSDIGTVNGNVEVVYKELDALAGEFHDFVDLQMRQNRLQLAKTSLVEIAQKLEKQFGHYDEVRRSATGILQADDLGLVRKETIATASEEMMISTPRYWLAPCLVALSAWINDQPELAERAVKEAIRRDDEKTSLFWALVCRRAGRKQACLKWTQRYLAIQNEENLNRNTIIILDAYAGGLLGADSEGVISQQMETWLSRLAEKPGFVEEQETEWIAAINEKRQPLGETDYTYLKKYSKTWPQMADVMEGAMLHAIILDYFTKIFAQQASNEDLKYQLDDILNSLVTDFDDEELPLRREQKFEQFVVDFGGDERRAKQNMQVEQTAFETHKNFTQLLTDAAMKPESANASVSTQKFAIALSKDWILQAYRTVIGTNRSRIPHEISFQVDTFSGSTSDGSNEAQVMSNFNKQIDKEKKAAIDQVKMTAVQEYGLYAGGAIAVIGLLMMIISRSYFLGLIAIIAGGFLVLNHFSSKKKVEETRARLDREYEEKRQNNGRIIRALLAEVVDYRHEFRQKDAQSQQVLDFMEQLSPDQFVRKLADSNRRIKV